MATISACDVMLFFAHLLDLVDLLTCYLVAHQVSLLKIVKTRAWIQNNYWVKVIGFGLNIQAYYIYGLAIGVLVKFYDLG